MSKPWSEVKHKRAKLDPTAAFLRGWRAFGQDLADFTGEPTILVRDASGMARFTLSGWPLAGDRLAEFQPAKEHV